MKLLLLTAVSLSLAVLLQGCTGQASEYGCDIGDGADVTISGNISFDRVPLNTNGGLDFSAIVSQPARGVVVQAVCNGVLRSTVSDSSGHYSFTVPANTRNLFIRARAEMRQQGVPSWNVIVSEASAPGRQVFTMDGNLFSVGRRDHVRNLHATTGWDGSQYSGPRVAAPFAILDTVYDAIQLVVNEAPTVQLPLLDIKWGADNASGTFYSNNAIWVLGHTSDSDEFDQHVIAHEWGHYLQDVSSRDESPGGSHTLARILDIRLAFSEGFGNAFSAMVTGDPVYKDSQSIRLATGFSFDIESNNCGNNRGWFNECSVQSILYDFYDPANDDALDYGFTPVYQTLTNNILQTDAFTSLFSFITPFKSQPGVNASEVDALLLGQGIAPVTDDVGSNRVLNPGTYNQLPVYVDYATDFPDSVLCNIAENGGYNGLGISRFIQFQVPATTTYTFNAIKVASEPNVTDPDVYIYHKGNIVGVGESFNKDRETLSLNLEVGKVYVLVLQEFRIYSNPDYNPAAGSADNETCFTISRT